MMWYRMFMAMWMAMCLVPIATISPNSVLIRSLSPNDIVVYIPLHIIVYRDGRYEKLVGCDTTPAGVDPSSGVQSKDVVILPGAPLSARLYIPKPQNRHLKSYPFYSTTTAAVSYVEPPLNQTRITF
ncbi:putative carboxylesterase [Helianthus annuus]|nr:putative carboxylesterase [Helianthus annuus]